MVAGKIALCIAVVGIVAGAAFAAEEEGRQADVLRLIRALEKAGLKVTPAEEAARGAAEAAVEDAAFDEIVEKLKRTRISVDYDDASLAEVLADLQRITGVNLLLDPKANAAREGASVTMKLENVRPLSVLGNVLRMFDLAAVYGDEALMVTLPSDEEAVTLVYDVHELTKVRDFSFPSRRILKGLETELGRNFFVEDEEEEKPPKPDYSAEELMDSLIESTPSGRWDDERYSITHINGVLVVTQRPDVQVRVANIIMALKARR